jgi:hypothetical protein
MISWHTRPVRYKARAMTIRVDAAAINPAPPSLRAQPGAILLVTDGFPAETAPVEIKYGRLCQWRWERRFDAGTVTATAISTLLPSAVTLRDETPTAL